jgi:hypothetical protein
MYRIVEEVEMEIFFLENYKLFYTEN